MKRAFIAFIPLLVALLSGCGQPQGPEQAIRDRIETMETGLAERSPGDVLDALSSNFLGGKSGSVDMDREAAKKMLAVYFLRYHRVGVVVSQVQVDIDPYEPQLASASAKVVLTGGERFIPNAAGFYQVQTQWRDFDGEWKITRMEWR